MVTHDLISVYVTRENLILFIQLYSQHFQRHLPILHAPSFRITQTPATVGDDDSWRVLLNNKMLVSSIIDLAMETLTLIEKQPVSFSGACISTDSNVFKHERCMGMTPLSKIQASVITCSILASSGVETASKFVFKCFARNISVTFEWQSGCSNYLR